MNFLAFCDIIIIISFPSLLTDRSLYVHYELKYDWRKGGGEIVGAFSEWMWLIQLARYANLIWEWS